jgi:hypothetical protein
VKQRMSSLFDLHQPSVESTHTSEATDCPSPVLRRRHFTNSSAVKQKIAGFSATLRFTGYLFRRCLALAGLSSQPAGRGSLPNADNRH